MYVLMKNFNRNSDITSHRINFMKLLYELKPELELKNRESNQTELEQRRVIPKTEPTPIIDDIVNLRIS